MSETKQEAPFLSTLPSSVPAGTMVRIEDPEECARMTKAHNEFMANVNWLFANWSASACWVVAFSIIST